jgi:predicted HTH transcriptional regulator
MARIDQVIVQYGGWPRAFDVPPPPPPTIEEIIKADESLELEFKTTFQWDVRSRGQSKDLQKSVLKTLAAFMNTEGGTLVIGVTDNKEIHGLAEDLTLTRDSVDVFEQTVLAVFSNAIGVAYAQHLSIRFPDAPGGKKVCVIVATRSPEPVFLEFQGKHEFFVRRGNASVALNPSEQHTYVRQHFRAN